MTQVNRSSDNLVLSKRTWSRGEKMKTGGESGDLSTKFWTDGIKCARHMAETDSDAGSHPKPRLIRCAAAVSDAAADSASRRAGGGGTFGALGAPSV